MGLTRQHRIRDTRYYAIADWFMAMIAWAMFFYFRKSMETPAPLEALMADPNFYVGVLLIPTGWVFLYSLFDAYVDIYRLSRLATLGATLFLSFTGVVFLFFTLILDDIVKEYQTYYKSFVMLFGLHFLLTATSRMILLTRASRRLKAGRITFNTLLIGANQNALELYQDLAGRQKGIGKKLIGYLKTDSNGTDLMSGLLPCLGPPDELPAIIETHDVEEAIIAVETSEHNTLRDLLNTLFDYDKKVLVQIIPDMYDILLGVVKMSHVYGAVLIEIRRELMPRWQRIIKRLIDLGVSLAALLLLSPLIVFIMLRVRLSSPGPIFYAQERLGVGGRPFTIFKFRSMYVDAEKNGPQLSSGSDPRCTPWGAVMRKWRLDEIPNFWNVLRGDMSLVGPRPERRHYIEQILRHNPHYKHLLKVRPGITSWGQVKYGYASNLDEMLQRLRFDLLYIENMSLALDFKIMFYTLLVLLQGRGK